MDENDDLFDAFGARRGGADLAEDPGDNEDDEDNGDDLTEFFPAAAAKPADAELSLDGIEESLEPTPGVDDANVSIERVEEMFEPAPASADPAAETDAADQPVEALLTTLATDLRKLEADLRELATDPTDDES